ncbi:MAG: RNA methyltransferase [Bacteroidaceae bacterium]|nr:RNA methyltransferase [Bacteroidaceae bacterium]
MLSKATLKLISSLEQKKFRKESGLFVAEGGKCVGDLIECGLKAEKIIATEEWLASHNINGKQQITVVNEDELKRASFLRTPQGILALFRQPVHEIDYEAPMKRLCLALDDVQDPGNLGTIIRIADWFGIEEIFCSPGCADIYNPKTVQATMGAIGRIKVFYTDLTALLERVKAVAPIYGTFLDGENMYGKQLDTKGIIVMGNEGKGISNECAQHIGERLFIPNYPIGRDTSESLNVSTATAIICSEFRRRMM